MSEIALQLEFSVEAEVSPMFAWDWRTDVTNWNDPPATFSLDGPFVAGAQGTTLLPEQSPVHWRIGAVHPGESFTIEVQLEGATLLFQWRFDALSEHRTKLTQRVVLVGDNAQAYAEGIAAGFGPTLAPGMERIAAEMAAAEKQAMGDGQ